MTCPQCGKVYRGSIAFCLEDGTPLIDAGAEQETVLKPHLPFSPPGILACSVCGLGNHANAKFCEQCGAVFPYQDELAGMPQPVPAPSFDPGPVPPRNQNVLIGVLAGLSLTLLLVIVYMLGGGGIVVSNSDLRAQGNNQNNASPGNSPTPSPTKSTPKPEKPISPENEIEEDPEEVPSVPYKFERTYRGRSNVPLTMTLNKNGSSLSGTAVTPGDIDYLSGTIDPDGSFDLAGDNQGNGITGHWRGQIMPNGTLRGTWTANSGKQIGFSARIR